MGCEPHHPESPASPSSPSPAGTGPGPPPTVSPLQMVPSPSPQDTIFGRAWARGQRTGVGAELREPPRETASRKQMLPEGPGAAPPPLWTEGHVRVSQATHYCSPLSGDECPRRLHTLRCVPARPFWVSKGPPPPADIGTLRTLRLPASPARCEPHVRQRWEPTGAGPMAWECSVNAGGGGSGSFSGGRGEAGTACVLLPGPL